MSTISDYFCPPVCRTDYLERLAASNDRPKPGANSGRKSMKKFNRFLSGSTSWCD